MLSRTATEKYCSTFDGGGTEIFTKEKKRQIVFSALKECSIWIVSGAPLSTENGRELEIDIGGVLNV